MAAAAACVLRKFQRNKSSLICCFYLLCNSFLAILLAPAAMTSFTLPDITKSANDKREYKAIQLANQLTVLLISDPGTEGERKRSLHVCLIFCCI